MNNKTKVGYYCKCHNINKVRNLHWKRARLNGVCSNSINSKFQAVAINIEYDMQRIIRMHEKMIEECKSEGKNPKEFIETHEKINQLADAVQKLYAYINKIKGGN